MPKPKWTIRSVKKWSKYLDRCVSGAAGRRFERGFKRAERQLMLLGKRGNTRPL